MGQKINPISLRLQTTNRYFDSCWYSDFYYTNLLSYDIKIRSYLDSILKQIDYPSGRFFIQSYKKNTKVFLFFCIPEKSRKIRFKLFNIKQHYSNNKNFQKINKKLYTKSVPRQSVKFIPTTNSISNQINKNLFLRYFLLQNRINGCTSLMYDKKNILNIKIYNNVIKQKLNKIQTLVINHQKLQNLELMKQPINLYHRGLYSPTSSMYNPTSSNPTPTLYIPTVPSTSKTFTSMYINSSFFLNSIFSEFPFLLKSYSYRKRIESVLSKDLNFDINLYPIKIYNDFRSALFIANEIVYYLERRVPFRKIKNRILKECSFLSNIKGLRITCSGRVGGRSKKAQRAKTECIKYGQTSLHIFSSPIDFASKTALTAFGSVGVKVWVCFY